MDLYILIGLLIAGRIFLVLIQTLETVEFRAKQKQQMEARLALNQKEGTDGD